jgi:cyclophilin family peptidyl-prolyl cis-trans isomerase
MISKTKSILSIKFVQQLTLSLCCLFSFGAHAESEPLKATINTSQGAIELLLYNKRTPKTVANFVMYAKTGFYNDTLFHRVIPNFMIQGGGFDQSFAKKATGSPVKNEANAFIPNLRGTISMARTNDPHSATSQFFINVKDNASLNKNGHNAGYAVFGKVVSGMEIADKISRVDTKANGYMRDIPVDPIIIKSITISGEKTDKPVAPTAIDVKQD